MAANQGQDEANANMLAALQQAVTALTQRDADHQQQLTTLTDLVSQQQQLLRALQPGLATAFHTSPAQAQMNMIIDLTTRAGISIHKETQRGLDDKYDLSKDKLVGFTRDLGRAALGLGCAKGATSVCHFTRTDGGPLLNLIFRYGELSIERIKSQSLPFISGANADGRQAQNNQFMVDFTLNSLTAAAKMTLLTYESEFTVQHNDRDIHVFPLMYKRLVSVPSLDSKLTARHLRTRIRDLPPKIATIHPPAWNEEFANLMLQLEVVANRSMMQRDTHLMLT